MPYTKFSVSMPEDLTAEIDARGDERSGVLHRMLGRYLQALTEARRTLREKLSDNEMGLILDMMNGVANFDAWSPSYLHHEIADGIGLEKMDKKWHIEDGAALVKKLAALSYIENVTVVDMCERWWQRVANGESRIKPAEAWRS